MKEPTKHPQVEAVLTCAMTVPIAVGNLVDRKKKGRGGGAGLGLDRSMYIPISTSRVNLRSIYIHIYVQISTYASTFI